MDRKIKEKLIAAGPEKLAQALLDLAARSPEAARAVQGLTASAAVNYRRLKAETAAVCSDCRFESRASAEGALEDLNALVDDIRRSAPDPERGLEIISDLYMARGYILSACENDRGPLAGFFSGPALKLFADFAGACSASGSKDSVCAAVPLLLRILKKDCSLVCRALAVRVCSFLSAGEIGALIASLEKWAAKSDNPYWTVHYLGAAEDLARVIGDGCLFERLRLKACGGTPSAEDLAAMADAYASCGNFDDSYRMLSAISKGELAKAVAGKPVLREVMAREGTSGDMIDFLRRTFRERRCTESLGSYLEALPAGEREAALKEEKSALLAEEGFSAREAVFMLDSGWREEAESYVSGRSNDMLKAAAEDLRTLADRMEKEDMIHSACLVNRAFVRTVLSRGMNKLYPEGAERLLRLAELEGPAPELGALSGHSDFLSDLNEVYRSKHGFWRIYRQEVLRREKLGRFSPSSP